MVIIGLWDHGRDPRDVAQACRAMQKHSYYRLGIVGIAAISGIEHALWDIAGKALDQPVWRRLGGSQRRRTNPEFCGVVKGGRRS